MQRPGGVRAHGHLDQDRPTKQAELAVLGEFVVSQQEQRVERTADVPLRRALSIPGGRGTRLCNAEAAEVILEAGRLAAPSVSGSPGPARESD